MRKEDRVRMPPPLVLDLPAGFKVVSRPGGYAVYYYSRMGMARCEDLVCAVDLGEVPDAAAFIREEVAGVWQRLNSPAGWRGIHLTPQKG